MPCMIGRLTSKSKSATGYGDAPYSEFDLSFSNESKYSMT